MNTTTRRNVISLLASLVLPVVASAAFNSGSTGAYGAMNITTDTTLAMPADGIFNCTTITVASGATLTFTPNALNTPVYLLATGDVTIAGTIKVDGQVNNGLLPGEGGPGGFRGGYPGTANLSAGGGLGPGGGAPNNNGSNYGVYGNTACIPLIGGSGGGGYGNNAGGSGGGGAILIASNTQINIASTGLVASRTGGGSTYIGSAGTIRIVAPVITGSGTVTCGSNGSGRIRVDTEDRLSWRTVHWDNIPGFAYGTRMVVFPSPVPQLDITEVAGTAIAQGTANPVLVTLPAGSPTTQNVKVKVTNLTGTVNIDLAVVPENGARTVVTTPVDMSGGSPVTITVAVTIPVGIRCAIQAYKK